MGRSECDNPGLIEFKDRWGAARSELTYLRSHAQKSQAAASSLKLRIAKNIFSLVPDGLLTTAGRVLYRHIG
jgi:hypothetical protein